jgi:hypothetical protein
MRAVRFAKFEFSKFSLYRLHRSHVMKNFNMKRCQKLFRMEASAILLVLLAAGCAHEPKHDSGAAAIRQSVPPVFLSGPAAVLLTNANSFTARLALTSASGQIRAISGRLFVSGSKFYFEPDPASSKQARANQFSFVWDAGANSGFILSEALQGYGPISSAFSYTNVATHDAPLASGRVAGYRVEQSTAVVDASNGQESKFKVSRARELNSLAVGIDSLETSLPYTITLSKVGLGRSPESLFLPPDGFTKYASADLMLNELVSRQQGNRHGDDDGNYHSGPMGNGGSNHHPGRYGSESEP